MVIPSGWIYTVKCEQTLFGQKVLNLFHYYINDPQMPPTNNTYATFLNAAFRAMVMPVIQACQNEDLVWNSVEVYNAVGYEDRFFYPLNETGLQSLGGSDSSFVAFGFKLVRQTNATRNGSKRIAGVPDNYVVGNNYTGDVGLLVDAAEAMQAVIQSPTDVDPPYYLFRPCIVHKSENIPYNIEFGNPVSNVQYMGLTSQVSRKRGRGI